MTENIDDLDRLYEALTTEGRLVDNTLPSFYYRGNMQGGWWGCYKSKDLEYRNVDGELHRINGPAYISFYYKVEEWYKNGELHRIGGPARIHKDSKWWYVDGKLHRLDGPAVDQKSHHKEYWIGGQQWSPKNYKKEIERRKRKGLIK